VRVRSHPFSRRSVSTISNDSGHGLFAGPIALKLARQRDPADGLASSLSDTLEAGPIVGIVGGLLMVAGAVGLAGDAPETASGEQRASSHTARASA
jgi:hypothetical protein